METRIRVNVFRQGERPFLVAEWRDPQSGKLRRQSTGHKVRREAERFAAKLEKELNDNQYRRHKTPWKEFRTLYVQDRSKRWRDRTKDRVRTILNAVEEILAPRLVAGIDAKAVMKFTAALEERGTAPATIAASLRVLKAALRWAMRKDLIDRVPDIEMPEGSIKCGGRAITLEEFERMLDAVPKVLAGESDDDQSNQTPRTVSDLEVESWKRFLWLLWVSGLRLGEAYKLHWTDDRDIMPDLSVKQPMFQIAKRASKNKKAERFFMSPECAAWLSSTPEDERAGHVANPLRDGVRVGYDCAGKMVASIGRRAKVVVGRDHSDEAVFASAHDLRRSAATRWAAKVKPSVLQAMMRHSSPMTTAQFYTDRGGEPIGDAIWESLSTGRTTAPITDPIPVGETREANA